MTLHDQSAEPDVPRSIRLLTALTTVVAQFALGHLLGFGGRAVASPALSFVVLAVGNATGVCVVGWASARLQALPHRVGLRAVVASSGGSAAGVGLLVALPPIGYAAVLVPLTLSIAAFHAANIRPAIRIAAVDPRTPTGLT